MIQAILTYKSKGAYGIHGQIVGADGSGTFAVVFEGESLIEAENAAREYVRGLTGRLESVHLVLNEEYFTGKAIRTIQVGMQRETQPVVGRTLPEEKHEYIASTMV